MERDRFDDVRLLDVEEPTARGPRRATRWTLSIVAAALTVGTLAVGASALTSSGGGSPPAPTSRQPAPQLETRDASWGTGGHLCPERGGRDGSGGRGGAEQPAGESLESVT